jgi:hypothetical protein
LPLLRSGRSENVVSPSVCPFTIASCSASERPSFFHVVYARAPVSNSPGVRFCSPQLRSMKGRSASDWSTSKPSGILKMPAANSVVT